MQKWLRLQVLIYLLQVLTQRLPVQRNISPSLWKTDDYASNKHRCADKHRPACSGGRTFGEFTGQNNEKAFPPIPHSTVPHPILSPTPPPDLSSLQINQRLFLSILVQFSALNTTDLIFCLFRRRMRMRRPPRVGGRWIVGLTLEGLLSRRGH